MGAVYAPVYETERFLVAGSALGISWDKKIFFFFFNRTGT